MLLAGNDTGMVIGDVFRSQHRPDGSPQADELDGQGAASGLLVAEPARGRRGPPRLAARMAQPRAPPGLRRGDHWRRRPWPGGRLLSRPKPWDIEGGRNRERLDWR